MQQELVLATIAIFSFAMIYFVYRMTKNHQQPPRSSGAVVAQPAQSPQSLSLNGTGPISHAVAHVIGHLQLGEMVTVRDGWGMQFQVRREAIAGDAVYSVRDRNGQQFRMRDVGNGQVEILQ